MFQDATTPEVNVSLIFLIPNEPQRREDRQEALELLLTETQQKGAFTWMAY